MIAAIPQVLIDMGAVAGVFVAILTLAALTWHTPPVQWFWRQVREDREERMLAAVTKGTEDIRKALEEHRQYVHYHLGPNGTTKPIHRRLCDLEEATGVED